MGKHEKKDLGDVSMADASTASAPDVSKRSKKDKKSKKDKSNDVDTAGDATFAIDTEGDEKLAEPENLSPIARAYNPLRIASGRVTDNCMADPLAQKKLTKKLFKTIKKAGKSRGHVRRGVKEVVKSLRKGEKGLVVLAGDISPMDILSHLPIICEDSGVPYVFVASKDGLGSASSTKRATSCVMIVPSGGKKAVSVKEEYQSEYDTIHSEVKALDEKLVMSVV